ncbi:short-chain dehydrogenase [marine bacterium AO1-C]|nr:short-chain dehydrogenase [marine bacterium AO1-C]
MFKNIFPSVPAPESKLYPHYLKAFPTMAGKTVAITGCTSGTGLVLAHICGGLGAKVMMLNRTSKRAEKALEQLQNKGVEAQWIPCDLLSFGSVRWAAEQLKTFCPQGLDVLCNNAGLMGIPDKASIDGFDKQMQANHLSHFLLTSLIWPLFEIAVSKRGEARIVNHSSGARKGRPLEARFLGRNGGNLGGDGFPGMGKWRRYQQSKLANLMFTYTLPDQIAQQRPKFAGKIKSLCAHPGPTNSGLQGKTAKAGGTRLLDQYILWTALKRAQSVEDGTMGIARACCEAVVESNNFYGPAVFRQAGPAELLPAERDVASETLLWRESLKATGLSNFFESLQAFVQ